MTDEQMLRASGCFFDGDEEEGDGYYDKNLVLNANDTWAWALAWCQDVSAQEIPEVARLYRRWGYAGLLYWMSEKNGKMKSEFKDINRFVEFVRQEEELIKSVPDSSKRAYMDWPRIAEREAMLRQEEPV